MKPNVVKVILKVLTAIGLFGLVTMWLWNALMPNIFGLHSLSFLQAIGLLTLTRLLFGGFGVLKDMSHFMARKERQAIFENWHSMSPEQRAQCIARVRSHGGKTPNSSFEKTEK